MQDATSAGSAGAGETLARGRKEGVTIVLKREEVVAGGHHGGAWKVAYADFVTAMMAFFLLMWLLNATTEEQRRGLADYFAPTNELGESRTGSGQPFGGSTPHEAGRMASNTGAVRLETGPRPILQDIELDDDSSQPAQPILAREAPLGQDETPEARAGNAEAGPRRDRQELVNRRGTREQEAREVGLAESSEQALRQELERREREALEKVAEQVRAAVRNDPALADLVGQLKVEQVPEGLRIQLLDADRQPMFALGGSTPNERSRALVTKVSAVIQRVPNTIAITGHTDATPFRGGERSNWDLSAERANATRRLLVEGGVAESRLRSVAGLAEREPLLPDTPQASANRRVAILLLRENPAPGTMPR